MAKTGVLSSDPTAGARAADLKKELQKLVKTIVDDEDFSVHTIDQAKLALSALRELKLQKRSTATLRLHESLPCPEEFICPLSKKLMSDPVILASGQTYDRPFIQRWLKAGNRTCPRTQQVLSHTVLTPNHLISEMISRWCESQGIELRIPVQHAVEDGVTEAELHHFFSLLDMLSAASLPQQKEAVKELRLLTKNIPSFRSLFGESVDAIPQLLAPLLGAKCRSGVLLTDLQKDVITTLLNLSIHDSIKKLVAETPLVVPLIMEALRYGIIGTRSNAAAAIFTLTSNLLANQVL